MIIAVHVPVAQLDRVLASEAEGCEFEPHRAHLIKTHQLITADVFFNLSLSYPFHLYDVYLNR